MIIVINYANGPYKKAQKYCTQSAYRKGHADRVIEYGPEDIDKNFYEKNKEILDIPRGGGLWLWKPYIILKTLDLFSMGDYLVYIDSGAYFVNQISYLTKALDDSGRDILCFSLGGLLEKQYTKPEVFELLNCNDKEYTDTPQRLATIIVCKKSIFTCNFFKEFLEYAQNKNLIYDPEEKQNREKYPYYIGHREDQSIFSILTKKYNLIGYRNPSQWGIEKGLTNTLKRQIGVYKYDNGNYPIIVIVHRCKKVDIKTKLKVFFTQNFPRCRKFLTKMFNKKAYYEK